MGTNYYAFDPLRRKKTVHLGKSSAGWCFGLHIYPEKGIDTLDGLLDYIKATKREIRDEYMVEKTINEFIDVVTNRSWTYERKFPDRWYASWSDFLEKNHAERGPNNLLRHKINGVHCIGHGEGTWDYIIGDFS